jgi:hypothetical protein
MAGKPGLHGCKDPEKYRELKKVPQKFIAAAKV